MAKSRPCLPPWRLNKRRRPRHCRLHGARDSPSINPHSISGARCIGADLSQIDSIGPQTALQLIAEIGTDTSRWPSEYHFASWTTLAPNNKISGGRLLSSRTPPSANRVAAILRRCAMSVGKTSTALGAFYRCLAVRIGKAKAIPPPPANLPSWSTACCPATSSITTPAQPLTINSTGSANSSHCASAPSSSASTSSIALPVKCS